MRISQCGKLDCMHRRAACYPQFDVDFWGIFTLEIH